MPYALIFYDFQLILARMGITPLAFQASTHRLLERPQNLAFIAPSAAGKTPQSMPPWR
jgi:hypothetical protein